MVARARMVVVPDVAVRKLIGIVLYCVAAIAELCSCNCSKTMNR